MMTQPVNVSKKTEDLLASFQQYGYELLKKQNKEVRDALRRRHINTEDLTDIEEIYTIYCRLSSLTPLEEIKEQILQQIDEVISFIKDFQIGVLGQYNTLFHFYEVEIIIGKNIRQLFKFESSKLLIQIPYLRLRFLNARLSCQNIKNLWNQGKHFDKTSPFYKYWWLFNPIGEFRSNLRRMLLLARDKKVLGLDKLLSEYGFVEQRGRKSQFLNDEIGDRSNFKHDLAGLQVHAAILAFLKSTVNEEKLRSNLDQILKDQDEATLVHLLALFKKNLTDPSQIEEIVSTGILILKEVMEEEESKVHIKMLGFVNVGNYHRIDVALSLSSGYLKQYIEVIPRKTAINATLFGLVNVYTIDDITVKSNFHGSLHLNFETVALERALKELRLLS
ncbi:hypothetical protein [Allocoleopsis franciscana]|uniref:Uncharacterized protein n=1 Tax=Allocoleopsis franciscana PCC 7113 TaxID=1173027 RepID=K9W877_9CYAN|nr:hypothetical protein [Allocoleopsis franciscana]AFZ15974.1 hypothetical protein Mic7113_0031 [Allocoleopsis franciscana PCC 7113]